MPQLPGFDWRLTHVPQAVSGAMQEQLPDTHCCPT
jgi:hypothetical protein